MEKRRFERYWEGVDAQTFLRGRYAEHPSRVIIADMAANMGPVLECGCGTAVDYPLHQERGTRYIGIDITEGFIEASKTIDPGADVRHGTILKLNFPDNSTPTVYARGVLEHLHPREWRIAVQEMWRVASKQMIIGLFNWRLDHVEAKEPKAEPSSFNKPIGHLDMAELLDSFGAEWNFIDTEKAPGMKIYRIYRAMKPHKG